MNAIQRYWFEKHRPARLAYFLETWPAALLPQCATFECHERIEPNADIFCPRCREEYDAVRESLRSRTGTVTK